MAGRAATRTAPAAGGARPGGDPQRGARGAVRSGEDHPGRGPAGARGGDRPRRVGRRGHHGVRPRPGRGPPAALGRAGGRLARPPGRQDQPDRHPRLRRLRRRAARRAARRRRRPVRGAGRHRAGRGRRRHHGGPVGGVRRGRHAPRRGGGPLRRAARRPGGGDRGLPGLLRRRRGPAVPARAGRAADDRPLRAPVAHPQRAGRRERGPARGARDARAGLIEGIIEQSEDEALMERYLAGEDIELATLVADLETAVAAGRSTRWCPCARRAGSGWTRCWRCWSAASPRRWSTRCPPSPASTAPRTRR
jgi:hypothetical protein